ALGYWPGATNAAAAACRVSPDGSVQILTGVADMSGVAGGFQAIVAETLGVEPDVVQIDAERLRDDRLKPARDAGHVGHAGEDLHAPVRRDAARRGGGVRRTGP